MAKTGASVLCVNTSKKRKMHSPQPSPHRTAHIDTITNIQDYIKILPPVHTQFSQFNKMMYIFTSICNI